MNYPDTHDSVYFRLATTPAVFNWTDIYLFGVLKEASV
jgi:hypothetical protein